MADMTIRQAMRLVELLDSRLKAKDFHKARGIGVSFAGYYQPMSRRTTSGCAKIICITTFVLAIADPQSLGPQRADVERWLDEKVPGWRKVIGFEEAAP